MSLMHIEIELIFSFSKSIINVTIPFSRLLTTFLAKQGSVEFVLAWMNVTLHKFNVWLEYLTHVSRCALNYSFILLPTALTDLRLTALVLAHKQGHTRSIGSRLALPFLTYTWHVGKNRSNRDGCMHFIISSSLIISILSSKNMQFRCFLNIDVFLPNLQ